MIIAGDQVRAARELLGWSQSRIAAIGALILDAVAAELGRTTRCRIKSTRNLPIARPSVVASSRTWGRNPPTPASPNLFHDGHSGDGTVCARTRCARSHPCERKKPPWPATN
jgi:hypothetical protein